MAELSRWYVVHTYSGYENKVATVIQKIVDNRNMHDLILDVNVPMEKVEEIKEDGTVKEYDRKIFPGYVMVKVAVFENEDTGEIKMSDETWYVIRNTRGVTGFVGPDGKPVPLTDREVETMGLELEKDQDNVDPDSNSAALNGDESETQEDERRVVEVNYEVGDTVTITDGPFEGINGIVRDIDIEEYSVTVEIIVAQRETPIALDLDQVKKADE